MRRDTFEPAHDMFGERAERAALVEVATDLWDLHDVRGTPQPPPGVVVRLDRLAVVATHDEQHASLNVAQRMLGELHACPAHDDSANRVLPHRRRDERDSPTQAGSEQRRAMPTGDLRLEDPVTHTREPSGHLLDSVA